MPAGLAGLARDHQMKKKSRPLALQSSHLLILTRPPFTEGRRETPVRRSADTAVHLWPVPNGHARHWRPTASLDGALRRRRAEN